MSLLTTVTKAKASVMAVLPHMRDNRVPFGLKVGTVGLALLIVSPLDIFGDIPVLGLLDDAVLLTLLSMGFVAIARSIIEKNVTPAPTPASPTGTSLQRL